MGCAGFLVLLFVMERFAGRQWDFGVYYMAGYAVNHGLNPYNRDGLLEAARHLPDVEYGWLPYLYPPVIAHGFRPLAWLPYFEAKYLWYVMRCTALEGMILLSMGLCRLPFTWTVWVGFHLAAVCFRPIRLDFNAGNMAVFEATLIYAFFWGWRQRFFKTAAFVLSLAGSIKVTPLLFVLYPLHLRVVRFLVPFGVCLSALGILSVLFDPNVMDYLAFYRSTLWMQIWDEQVQSFFNCSSTTVILRSFTDTYFAQPLIESDLLALVLIPIFPIMVFLAAVYTLHQVTVRRQYPELHESIISLLMITLLLLPPRLAGYTLSWLYFPIVYLLKEGWVKRDYPVILLIGLALVLLQVVIPPEHVQPGFSQLLIDKEFFGLFTVFIAVILFLRRSLK